MQDVYCLVDGYRLQWKKTVIYINRKQLRAKSRSFHKIEPVSEPIFDRLANKVKQKIHTRKLQYTFILYNCIYLLNELYYHMLQWISCSESTMLSARQRPPSVDFEKEKANFSGYKRLKKWDIHNRSIESIQNLQNVFLFRGQCKNTIGNSVIVRIL